MPGPQKEELTVIRAGTLIDGKGGPPRANQVIVVRGYRIERVQDAAAGEIPAEAKVIDLSKATVLPGLIDAHTHIFLQGEDPAQGGYDVQLLKYGLAFRAARAAVAARRALDQGLHDAPLVARQARQLGLAAHADAGGAEGHCGGGAWLEEEGRLPRLQRRGAAPRARWRLRLHRAWARAR